MRMRTKNITKEKKTTTYKEIPHNTHRNLRTFHLEWPNERTNERQTAKMESKQQEKRRKKFCKRKQTNVNVQTRFAHRLYPHKFCI